MLGHLTYAQPQTTSNRVNPNWTNNAHWTSTSPGYDTNQSAILTHNSTLTGEPITVNAGDTLWIAAGDTLTTDEIINVKENGVLIIEGRVNGTGEGKEFKIDKGELILAPYGELEFQGYWTSDAGPSSITINGEVTIHGDFTNNQTITGAGSVNVGGTLDNTDGSIFGCTAAGSGCCGGGGLGCLVISPLPVELLDFVAKELDLHIQLGWATESESNNLYFTIERSIDGKTFLPIAQVTGKGTHSSISHYRYMDKAPPSGVLSYRLKQTDFNGSFERFHVVSVRAKPLAPPTLQINPTLVERGGTRSLSLFNAPCEHAVLVIQYSLG